MAGGFTLIELLVVVGILALLVGIFLPVLTRVRSRATGLLCLNHVRQLQTALVLYAQDNRDRLTLNLDTGRPYPVPGLDMNQNWVNNVLSWELDSDNTNLAFMAHSPLASFIEFGPQVFVCPSDRVLSTLQRQAGWSRRVRSMSLNSMVGDPVGSRTNRLNPWNPDYRQYVRLSDVANPTGVFTFLDENADSIEHGYFWNSLDDGLWTHLPASYHRGGANVAFMDGHVDLHRWVSPVTRRAARPNAGPLPFPVPEPGQVDFEWLAKRSSERNN